MKLKLNRGFTLIELLVVIAIIGILASVVLASLNTARDKGADAAIKSTINNTRAEAELFYDTSTTYSGLCATLSNAAAAVNSAGGSGSWTCDDDNGSTAGESFVITGELSDGSFYCVDSSGASATTSAAVTTQTTCSAI